MRVYMLPSSFKGERELILGGKDAHYLTRVLRMRVGSGFTGRDNRGKFWDLQVVSIDQRSCTLSCSEAGREPAELSDALPSYRGPFAEIHLYQGICKGKKMDQIIRQATEIGVSRIIPVSCSHSVVDLVGKEEERRRRLEGIVKEALQQSGSPVMTTVASPLDLSQVPGDWQSRGPALVLHQVAMGEQVSLYRSIIEDARQPIALLVGPEGGFSDEEVAQVLEEGFSPVLMRTNILRAETAAVVAAGMIQQMLAELL